MCRSAGSRAAALALSCLLAATAVHAQGSPPAEGSGRTADIRIELPGGSVPSVTLEPGTDRIVLDLPRGAAVPQDFSAASGGLLRDGSVRVDGDRLRMEIDLAQGFLERVEWGPDVVVLHFASRFRDAPEDPKDEGQYRVGADDRLLVTVHNHTDLSGAHVVSRDGFINAPLIGDVRAAGLTPRQLATRLAERFDRTYLVSPQVDVAVEEYRSQWVIVGGEVRNAGRVPLRGGTRLKEVLGESQGFTQFAGETVTISRKLANGNTAVLEVPRPDFESGKTNPLLEDGDLIEVPRARSVYIQGEVRDSGEVRVERGMTLMRVIAHAGGLTDWANRKEITVLYDDQRKPGRMYNLNKIENGKVADPVMEGGEMIIIKRRFL